VGVDWFERNPVKLLSLERIVELAASRLPQPPSLINSTSSFDAMPVIDLDPLMGNDGDGCGSDGGPGDHDATAKAANDDDTGSEDISDEFDAGDNNPDGGGGSHGGGENA
jgi:hypothetical protein